MNYLYLLFISLFFYANSFSQVSGFGIGAGLSQSDFDYGDQVTNVPDFNSKTKTGLNGGMKLDVDLGTDIVKISPEVFFIQNGSNEYYNDFQNFQNDVLSRKVNLNYGGIYLPIVLFLPFNKSSDPDFFNGFMFSGRFYGDYVFSGNISDQYATTSIKFQGAEDKLDYGFGVDGGILFHGVSIRAGYNWGIKDVKFTQSLGYMGYLTPNPNNTSERYLLNNHGFVVLLGYSFKFENGN